MQAGDTIDAQCTQSDAKSIAHLQVYLALEELGWRPAVKTWCDSGLHERLPQLAARHRDFIYSLFDAHVDAGLAWLASHK